MGTTSSFFGGGGGTAIDPVNPRFLKNVTFSTNTQFAVSPTDQRGYAPITIPCTDTTFFLLEGNSTSDIYVSYWELGSDGAATQLATAVQITGCDEVASAAANGIDRLMVVGGTNYDIVYGVYYNGSTLTVSNVRSASQTYQSMSTCTCTLDGTLIGCVSTNSGNQSTAYTAAILTDGTVLTDTLPTDIQRDNYGRLIGTEQGIMGLGRTVDVTASLSACKISVIGNNNSSLAALSKVDTRLPMNSSYFNGGNNYPPFIVPSQGGLRVLYLDFDNRVFNLAVNSRDARILQLASGTSSTTNGVVAQRNMAAEYSNGIQSTFSRQANGTWLAFKGANSTVNYTLFNDEPSFRTPFADLVPQGDAQSSGMSSGRVSTSVVGDFVLSTWYDETDGDVNIDAWNFKG
jgi:hypothetical protein